MLESMMTFQFEVFYIFFFGNVSVPSLLRRWIKCVSAINLGFAWLLRKFEGKYRCKADGELVIPNCDGFRLINRYLILLNQTIFDLCFIIDYLSNFIFFFCYFLYCLVRSIVFTSFCIIFRNAWVLFFWWVMISPFLVSIFLFLLLVRCTVFSTAYFRACWYCLEL